MVDMVVHRHELRATCRDFVASLTKSAGVGSDAHARAWRQVSTP